MSDQGMAKIITWDAEDAYGIYVDYGSGSYRSYLVGSMDDARRELARFTFDKREHRAVKLRYV